MAKKDTNSELLALHTKMQEAHKQCEELKMNLIKSIIGDIKLFDLVMIHINGKYYEGMLMDVTVYVLGHSVGFIVKDGNTNRYFKYKVGEDDFKIEKIV